jgi:hypothetical protein
LVELDLPPALEFHPRVHVEKLRQFNEDAERFPTRRQINRQVAVHGKRRQKEWGVERILAEREVEGEGIQYLLLWEGYTTADASWQWEWNLGNASDLVAEWRERKEREQQNDLLSQQQVQENSSSIALDDEKEEKPNETSKSTYASIAQSGSVKETSKRAEAKEKMQEQNESGITQQKQKEQQQRRRVKIEEERMQDRARRERGSRAQRRNVVGEEKNSISQGQQLQNDGASRLRKEEQVGRKGEEEMQERKEENSEWVEVRRSKRVAALRKKGRE